MNINAHNRVAGGFSPPAPTPPPPGILCPKEPHAPIPFTLHPRPPPHLPAPPSLPAADLTELERFLFESGEIESRDQLDQCFGKQDKLSVFIRSIVGLDRETAKKAFSKYLDTNQFNTHQIRFIEMIIDHLTQKGVMDAGLLYEQPFTGIHDEGLDGVFPSATADEIVRILEQVNGNAEVWAVA